MLRFCADYATEIGRAHLDRWTANHVLPNGEEEEQRGYMKAMGDLATITHNAVNEFYGVQPEVKKEEPNET